MPRLGGALLLLVAVAPLGAQNILGNSKFSPFSAFNTSKVAQPPSLAGFKAMTLNPKSSNLTNLPKLSLMPGRWPASGGSTGILPSSSNPFQPVPPQGFNPFSQKPVNALTP
jgi:hypothetical protein